MSRSDLRSSRVFIRFTEGRSRAWTRQIRTTLALAVAASVAVVAPPLAAPAAAAPAVPAAAKPECPAERPDEASAALAAKLCGKRVGVSNARTETTEVWVNPDGTLTAERHFVPVRVQQGGKWVPVDLTLERKADGSVGPKVHGVGVRLSGGKPSVAAADGTRELVSLGSGDDQVGLDWAAALPEPVLTGATATYRDVYPGVDLLITVHRTGYEQSFVVKNRAGLAHVRKLTVPLRTGKSTVGVDSAGGFAMRKSGRAAARTYPAEMWDAAVAPNSGDRLRRGSITMRAAPGAAGRTNLEMIPDAGFLDRGDLEFPVTIDPPTSLNPGFDAFVQTGYTSDQSGMGELKLGYSDDGGPWTARSYLKFDTSGMAGQGVTDATLHLYETHSWSCRTAGWEAKRTADVGASVRWTSQPAWYETIGTSTQTTGFSSSCNDGWVAIGLTPGFQSAATNGWSSLSVVLKATNESHHDGWKRFHSMEGANDPYVTLTYNNPPNAPSVLTVAPCYTSCNSGAASSSLRPTLSAVMSDPNAGDSVRPTFEVWNAGHTTQVATSGLMTGVSSGATATWQVPADLTNGTTYEFRVKGNDGRNDGAWSAWTTFTVDTVKPGVPFVSAGLYLNDGQPHGGAGVADTFTLTPAAGTTDLAAFVYQLDTATTQTTLPATAATTVPITPPSDGHRSLTVWAKDRAGNLSNPNVYAFSVGSAALAQPLPGATLVKRTKLAVDSVVPQYTRAYFEYRRGPGGAVLPVPSAHLLSATGGPVTATAASPANLSAIGGSAIWNAVDTLGAVGGVVEIRAQMYTDTSTTPVYATAWVRATVDPNGDDAASAEIGPGSVNLLTGDFSTTDTDTEDLGLSVSRSTSSRASSGGWLAQGERLTVNQQQVSTDLTGFVVPFTTTAARSTAFGQGETTPVDSLAITPGTYNDDTYVAVGGDNGGFASGMQPGKTYRLTGWVYVPGSSGLATSLTARGVRIVGFANAGGFTEVTSPRAAYTDAWQQLSLTMTIPGNATEAFFRLYNGHAANSGRTVYWDHLSMTEVVAPFGPSWQAGATGGVADVDYTTITQPEPSVAQVNLIGGGWVTFSKNADGVTYTPEPGSEGLVLTKVNATTFRLSELDGTVSEFVQQGAVFAVTTTWTPESSTTARYVYDTTGNRTLLKKVINPVEPGVDDTNSCTSASPARGCEVLEYTYATSTTSGLSQTVFGDYTDRVSDVKLWTWDPVLSAQTSVQVARYTYDDLGQLREVWDPRVSPTLKTTYEYTSGRVSKITNAGQLPWMLDYGNPDVDPDAQVRWNFDESSGTAVDSSGKGRTGTFAGGAYRFTGNDGSYPGDNAGYFTQVVGQQVTAPGAVVNTSQSFTVSAWAMLMNNGGTRTVVSQDGGYTSGFFLNYVGGTDRWSFAQMTCDCSSAAPVRATSTNPPILGKWTHLTGVFDATAGVLRLYVDGVLQSTTARPTNWNATGAFVVGRAKWTSATNTFQGGIDDVRAYQKVLTADQIAALAGDENPGRLVKVRRAALQQGSKTVTDGEVATNVVYRVPLTQAAGGPYNLDAATIGTWAQKDLPTDATAIFGAEDVPAVNSATDTVPGSGGYPYAMVHYLNANGQQVNTASPGGQIDTNEYDKFGNVVRTLEATDRALALGTLPGSGAYLSELGLASVDTATRANALSTVNTYSTDGTDLIDVLGPTNSLVLEYSLAASGKPTLAAGTTVVGRQHTVNVYDEGKPDGANYHLVTTTREGIQVTGYPDADSRVTANGYGAEQGGTSGWTLRKSTRQVADAGAGGAALNSYAVYDVAGRTTATWGIGSTGSDARTRITRYYTAGIHPTDTACGNKPEWAGQTCVATVAAPPGTVDAARLAANLPLKRITSYDRWGAPAVVTENVAGTSAARTTTTVRDTSGRVQSVQVVATGDGSAAVAATTTSYDPATGQATVSQTGTLSITREYDQLGRLVRYTDSDGAATTYEFNRFGKQVKLGDPFGNVTFAYDRAVDPRGLLTSLTDSIAGTFTAGYSPDGQMTTLKYPGGLTRVDTLDANLRPRTRTYTRDSDGLVLYSESVARSSSGQIMQNTYTGGSKAYAYDRLGRLVTATQDSGTTAGCVGRTYGYDNRTNRTARNLFAPAAGGACPATSGTPTSTETHTYDVADRITDAGYVHDAFGRITALPGGQTNAYFANDLIASQQLGDSRQAWTLDGKLRQRGWTVETLVGGVWTQTASKLNHYGDDTDVPRWIVEDSGTGGITRNVVGPDTDLAATTTAAGAVKVQLTNLHGDVVVSVDTTLTAPEIYEWDEFGVATAGYAQRYGWLGGKQRSAEALGGTILMGARLYLPVLGRFLQVDPEEGGSATAYDYCYADPVNCFDLDGRWPSFMKKAGKWLSNNAGTIGTVLGTAATIMAFIPPLQVAAAVLGAVATGFSLWGARNDWKAGNRGSAILGVAMSIPGVGGVGRTYKVAKAFNAARKAKKARQAYRPGPGSRREKDLLNRANRKADRAYQDFRRSLRGDKLSVGLAAADVAKWRCGSSKRCQRRFGGAYWVGG